MTERSTRDSSDGNSPESPDPTAIETVVITIEDLVTALEATLGTGREAVLRITPPFSGRMRARIHLAGADDYDDPAPIHLDPTTLVEPCPRYPTAAETAAELDSPDDSYTDRHEETHTERLAAWREAVRANIVDTTEINTPTGAVVIEVRWLGES